MATKAANDQPKSNLSPDTFLEMYRSVRDAARELSEAQAKHRNALKRAKGAGIDLAAFKEAIALKKQDRDVVEQHFATLARYSAWLGMPLGTQGNMFGEAEAPSQKMQAEQGEWAAEDAGYDAGRAGRGMHDHPYDAGTPMHAAWHRGWVKGQTFIAESMGGEVPKRGRKGKRANAEDGPPVMDAAA